MASMSLTIESLKGLWAGTADGVGVADGEMDGIDMLAAEVGFDIAADELLRTMVKPMEEVRVGV
jgi:hypothetical protein